MRELEDRQCGPDVRGVDGGHLGQRRFDQGQFAAEVGEFRVERRFVDRPSQERVQEPVVHRRQFAAAFGLGDPLVALQVGDIGERRLERRAEPFGHLVVRHLELGEIGDDRVFQVIAAPTNRWVIVVRVVVRAAVVIVRSHAAALQLALDPLARDERSAVLAGEESTSQRHVDLRLCSAVLSAQDILARLKRGPVDQSLEQPCVGANFRIEILAQEPNPLFADVQHDAVPAIEVHPLQPGIADGSDVSVVVTEFEHLYDRS